MSLNFQLRRKAFLISCIWRNYLDSPAFWGSLNHYCNSKQQTVQKIKCCNHLIQNFSTALPWLLCTHRYPVCILLLFFKQNSVTASKNSNNFQFPSQCKLCSKFLADLGKWEALCNKHPMRVTACQILKDRLMPAGATGASQQGETWRSGQLAILDNFISKNCCQRLYTSKSLAPVSSCCSAFLQLQLPAALWSTFPHPLPLVNLVMENPSQNLSLFSLLLSEAHQSFLQHKYNLRQ